MKAGKVDDDDSHTLINLKVRGGLWKVGETTQNVFEICEIAFKRKRVKFLKSHKVDIKELCASLMKNPVFRAGEMDFKVEGPCNTKQECRPPWLSDKKNF